MTLVFVLLGITLFFGIAFLTLAFPAKSTAEVRLSKAIGTDRLLDDRLEQPRGPLGQVTQFVTSFLERIGLTDTTGVERQLALAGYRKPEHVQLYLTVKLLLPVMAALGSTFIFRQNLIFWLFACTAMGYFLPDLWLSSAITRRREAIRLALPDSLDLLVICMEAGLGMDQALIRVGAEMSITHPELSDEFRMINLEQRAGTPRIDAWRHMGERTRLDIVTSFVSMLVQTDRFGTPVSKSLGAFADSLRLQRRQRAEELAAKTTIKMVFPLVLFIFPSMFIVLLAPAIISIKHNMGALFQ